MNYLEKLKSPKWQKKRLEVLSRDNFTCCTCGDNQTELHVHHLKYTKEPYDSPLEDLQTLCKHCHYYFTYFFEKNLKWFSEKKEFLNKICKVENTFIVEFKNNTIIFFINDSDLEYIVCFKKDSKALETIYNLNKL